jgi:ribosome-associated toxin RatA of RatAB toxin-antitoxin module
MELVSDIGEYPRWCPDVVREVMVLERDSSGQPTKVAATLHAEAGPLVRDFRLALLVRIQPASGVELIRIPHEPSDPEQFRVSWAIQEGHGQTQLSLELDANLSVPRLLPIGAVGDSIASSLVEAAKRALSRSR